MRRLLLLVLRHLHRLGKIYLEALQLTLRIPQLLPNDGNVVSVVPGRLRQKEDLGLCVGQLFASVFKQLRSGLDLLPRGNLFPFGLRLRVR